MKHFFGTFAAVAFALVFYGMLLFGLCWAENQAIKALLP